MRAAMTTIAAALALSGCSAPASSSPGTESHGRYAGIGTYSPGELWSRMATAQAPAASDAATIADDEHVIVVVDNQSGEVRECGDYSGVCVSMNPWTRAIAMEHASPVKLTKHLREVQQEQRDMAHSVLR